MDANTIIDITPKDISANNLTEMNTSFTIANSEFKPLITWKPDYVLTVHGENGNTLAKILANGAVEMDEANANAAAKIFWQAIHFARPHCPNCNSELQLV